jgi:hypothetical protein
MHLILPLSGLSAKTEMYDPGEGSNTVRVIC